MYARMQKKLSPDGAIVCCHMRSDNTEAQDENAANAAAKPVATPVREFKHQPHRIRNQRSSTGYKGINFDEDRGVYRVKFEGVTIGRYDSLDKAC